MTTKFPIYRPAPGRADEQDAATTPSRGGYPHARYSHQLSEEASDAALRTLVRVVPIVVGGMLGSVAENLMIGLGAALAITLAFDLSMEQDSIVRALFGRLRILVKPRRSR